MPPTQRNAISPAQAVDTTEHAFVAHAARSSRTGCARRGQCPRRRAQRRSRWRHRARSSSRPRASRTPSRRTKPVDDLPHWPLREPSVEGRRATASDERDEAQSGESHVALAVGQPYDLGGTGQGETREGPNREDDEDEATVEHLSHASPARFGHEDEVIDVEPVSSPPPHYGPTIETDPWTPPAEHRVSPR
ncbi:MAG: hypothetical protein WDN30_06165 [Pararobbsia sp.]